MECAVEDPVVAWAKAHGWLVRKLAWVGRRDAPDRLFIKAGRVVFIEFKDRDEPLRLSQRREHDKLRAAGAEVYVCDTREAAIAILGS